jgi:hypothetical protein
MTKGNALIFSELCRASGLPVPTPEHKFHVERNWRMDYAWPSEKLALEIEGGVWMSNHGKKSRHFTGTGAVADMIKYNTAASLGWRILRVTPSDLLKVETINLIKKSLHK